MTKPFDTPADAAKALLMLPAAKLNRRSGQFLGGTMFDDAPLSDKQARWLGDLLDKYNLPRWVGGEA